MRLPRGRKAILLGLAIGLAASGGLVFTRISGASAVPTQVPDPATGQRGVMLALDERVINLRAGGPFRYAKVALTVEFRPDSADFYGLSSQARAAAEKEAIAARSPMVPLLLDAVGTVVSSMDPTQLTTPEGRGTLKEDLLGALRAIVGEREILGIYFTDLVMQ